MTSVTSVCTSVRCDKCVYICTCVTLCDKCVCTYVSTCVTESMIHGVVS